MTLVINKTVQYSIMNRQIVPSRDNPLISAHCAVCAVSVLLPFFAQYYCGNLTLMRHSWTRNLFFFFGGGGLRYDLIPFFTSPKRSGTQTGSTVVDSLVTSFSDPIKSSFLLVDSEKCAVDHPHSGNEVVFTFCVALLRTISKVITIEVRQIWKVKYAYSGKTQIAMF